MSRAFLRYLDGRQGRDGRKKLKISNLGFGVDAAGIHDAAGSAFSISGTCNRRDWHLAWPDFCYRGFHLGRMTGIVNENRAAETCRKKEAAVSIDCLRLPLHLKRCVHPGPTGQSHRPAKQRNAPEDLDFYRSSGAFAMSRKNRDYCGRAAFAAPETSSSFCLSSVSMRPSSTSASRRFWRPSS